jgi:hypothetical protein
MTLKEKFSLILMQFWASDWEGQCEQVADEFAIDFYNWMKINDTKQNSDKYFHYTDKDMLMTFKEYKGL